MSLAAGTEVQGPACLGGPADLVLPAGTGASSKDKEWDCGSELQFQQVQPQRWN